MKTFYATFILSVLLIVVGFFLPPVGVIDGSVVTSVGELLMFAVIAQMPSLVAAAKNGRSIKVQRGDASVEITSTNTEAT